MQNNDFSSFGIDPSSQDFTDLVDTACHYAGGRKHLLSLVIGCAPGSKTMTSDSLALVLALGYSAIDLNKPEFAFRMARSFMASFANKMNELTADEIDEIEILFLTALHAGGLTDAILAQYKNSTQSDAGNGTKNV